MATRTPVACARAGRDGRRRAADARHASRGRALRSHNCGDCRSTRRVRRRCGSGGAHGCVAVGRAIVAGGRRSRPRPDRREPRVERPARCGRRAECNAVMAGAGRIAAAGRVASRPFLRHRIRRRLRRRKPMRPCRWRRRISMRRSNARVSSMSCGMSSNRSIWTARRRSSSRATRERRCRATRREPSDLDTLARSEQWLVVHAPDAAGSFGGRLADALARAGYPADIVDVTHAADAIASLPAGRPTHVVFCAPETPLAESATGDGLMAAQLTA